MKLTKRLFISICLVALSAICSTALSLKDELSRLFSLKEDHLVFFLTIVALFAIVIPIYQAIIQYFEKPDTDKKRKIILSDSKDIFEVKNTLLSLVENTFKGILENEINNQINKYNKTVEENYSIKVTHGFYDSPEFFFYDQQFKKDISAWDIRKNDIGLVFVGDPGTGKTYSMSAHLLKVIETIREKSFHKIIVGPVPVYLSLSSWDGQCLEQWILKSIIGNDRIYRKKEIVKYLLRASEIIPCLDDFDAVPPSNRLHCLRCIIDYTTKRSVVFACRRQEFIQLICNNPSVAKSRLLKVISVEKLQLNLVQRILKENARNSEQLMEFLDQKVNQWNKIDTPLYLNMFLISFGFFSTQEIDELKKGSSEIERMLWEKYEELTFRRYLEEGTILAITDKSKIRNCLTILANNMTGQRFNLNKLSPEWLPNAFATALYCLISGVFSGLLLSVGVGCLIATPFAFISNGLFTSLISAFILWRLRYFRAKNNNARPHFFLQLFILMSLVVAGIYQGFAMPAPNDNSVTVFSFSESFPGILVGILFGWIFGHRVVMKNCVESEKINIYEDFRNKVNSRYRPNFHISRSLNTSLKSAIFSFLIYSLVFSCFIFFLNPMPDAFTRSLIMALGVSIISLLRFGLIDIIDYWSLRLILSASDIIPLRFEKYVNMAIRLGFLRKIDESGGVAFQHVSYMIDYRMRPAKVVRTRGKSILLVTMYGLLFLTFFYVTSKPFIDRYGTDKYWKKSGEILVTEDYLLSSIRKINDNEFVMPKKGFLQVKIEGQIHLGTFTGSTGPEGTEVGLLGFPLSTVFNKDSYIRHGALIYKIKNGQDTTWKAVVRSGNFLFSEKRIICIVVNRADTLSFDVNDKYWTNNSGHFRIDMRLSDSCSNLFSSQ